MPCSGSAGCGENFYSPHDLLSRRKAKPGSPMEACDLVFQCVGVAGFEPTASSSRTRYGSRSYLQQH